MKIGLIIYDSIHTTTGGYIYDKKLVDYLASKEIEVRLFSQQKSPFAFLKNNFSKKMMKELLSFSPDVLLQDEMNFISLVILNKKLKKRQNVFIVSIVHLLQAKLITNVFKSWFTRTLEKLYLKTIDGIVFNSRATKQCIETKLKITKKSVIAYPGKDRLQPMDCEKICGLTDQNSPLKLIFIGNLFYNKGLHVLLRAVSGIDRKAWNLSIAGAMDVDYKYTRTILNMISQLNLEQNVTFHGLLESQCLKQLLGSQQVLVLPSYYESFGMVYLEAMGAGIPVIACNQGGAREIVEDAKNGFLINPGDVVKLRECIMTLIDDRLLLKRMSFYSLTSYKRFPTWDESMEQIHLFLKSECSPILFREKHHHTPQILDVGRGGNSK